MQQNRFVVLTGHLSSYPLSDLVGILHRQRKSGRLTIEYPNGPASFFFKDGELVDAQMNDLIGLQAVCVAVAAPESPFNFNPLIGASRRSISPSVQRVVSELLGCWDESPLEIVSTPVSQSISSTTHKELSERKEPLLLPAPPLSLLQRRSVLFVASAGFLGFGLSSLIMVMVAFNSVVTSAEASKTVNSLEAEHKSTPARTESLSTPNEKTQNSEQPRRSHTRAAPTKERTQLQTSARAESKPSSDKTESEGSSTSQSTASPSVNVVLQIENGRVVKASIAGHKPGMDGYEGLALRIARQRRYPAKQNGQETIRINVP